MYQEYSKLQAKQMLKQSFADTQSTHLLLYAPGRTRLLAHSLPRQLHQKFRLITAWETPLSPAADGIVLIADDGELLSTALLQFAQALQNGADFVYSDAAFGYDGETGCYRTDTPDAGCKLAVVSRALLLRILPAVESCGDLRVWIAAAAAAAQSPCHLAQALVQYRREIQPDDIYSAHGRRALVLSHELTMSGAPIVLVEAIPVLRRLGFEVVVLSKADKGPLPLFTAAGAIVVTHSECLQPSSVWGLMPCCDFILANTIMEVDVIRALNGAPVPVLWWLHDAFIGYGGIEFRIPHTLEPNIRVCAVGSHATAAMHSVRPDFDIAQLIYGLTDYAAEEFPVFDISFAGGRPLFVTVGTFEERKGQDIFVKAIRLLPAEVRRRAAFLFVGKGVDRDLLKQVTRLCSENPDCVFYIPRLTREEIKSLMQQSACVVCASRDDPMPTFITEGMIFSTPFITSENTGTAGLTTEGVDGWVYRDDDPQELADALARAIEAPELLSRMGRAARALYERSFTRQSFEKTLIRLVKEITGA